MDIPTYAEAGRPGRMVVARLGEGQDLVESAFNLIESHGFQCGAITALGALKRGAVKSPRSFEFRDPCEVMVCRRVEGPVELGLGHGVFGRDEHGVLDVHIHGVIMNTDGEVYCGDLVPGENPAWCMVELVIMEFEGVRFNPIHNRIAEWKRAQEEIAGQMT